MKTTIIKSIVLLMLSLPAFAKVNITPIQLEAEILEYANSSVETGGLGLSEAEGQNFLEKILNLSDPSGYLACHRLMFRFAMRSNLEDGLGWDYKRSTRFAGQVALRDDRYDYTLTFKTAYIVVRHLLGYDTLGQRSYAVKFSHRFASMPNGMDGLFVFADAYLDYYIKNPSDVDSAKDFAEEKLLEWQEINSKN